MAETVDVRTIRVRFSKLLRRVMRGEEIVVVMGGKPVARLVPAEAPNRVPGIDTGKLRIAHDFDKMSRSELADWYEPGVSPK